MKDDAMGIGTPINKKDMKDVIKESKENNAVDSKNDYQGRSFGLIDLWNVRKRQRTSSSMSRWLN